jgi:Bacterial Ig-like domain
VTSTGVFWMQDWTATGATWVNITNNMPSIQSLGFGNPNWSSNLLATPTQTPQFLTIAVDWRPTYSPTPGQPILYVGGDGGVFKGRIDPTNAVNTVWARYTNAVAQGAATDGGGLPVVKVVDLDISAGNIDPNTGRVITAGAPGILVATTLGRGVWAIALGQPAGVSGPRITDFTPNTPQKTSVSDLTVTFNVYVDPTSFTAADVTVTDPSGQVVPIADVQDITNPAPGQPNLHNQWEIDFVPALKAEGTYTVVIGPDITDGTGTKMDQNQNGINGEPVADQFKTTFIIGENDLTDFVLDSYEKLLGRDPTTAEYNGAKVQAMVTSRLTALGTELKELLGTYNSNGALNGTVGEARQRLIERLVDNGGAAGEIGNLLPGFVLAPADRDAFATALKNGQKSPESIMLELIATQDSTKPWYNKFVAFANPASATPAEVDNFLTKLYADLYKGLAINPITMLATTTLAAQRSQAVTPAGRFNLVKSLINNATVTYYPNGFVANPVPKLTTSYRINFVNLAYAKYLPGYTPTASELTATRNLIGKPLAANSLQGSEWVAWKLLSSITYFNRKTQADGLPDDGLHTDRSWIAGVIQDRLYRASTTAEKDTYSAKILNLFKTQRAAFLRGTFSSSTNAYSGGVVSGTEFRKIQITNYFQLVFGPSRVVSATELSTWQNSLAHGGSFAGLVGNLLGTAEYYNAHTNPSDSTALKNQEWANAVYETLLNRAATSAEVSALVSKIASSGRAGAAGTVVNGNEFRDKIITQWFTLLLNRAPTASELSAYENFLKTNNHWEMIAVDIMSLGAAVIPGSPPTPVAVNLPREFWEIKN